MKFIKDDVFASLQSSAQHWQTIVSAIKEGNPEFDSENATPESVAEALAGSSSNEQLQSDLKTANATIETLRTQGKEKDTTISNLQGQVQTLKGLPTESTAGAGGGQGAEVNAEEGNELVSFASENKEDYLTIASKAVESGFFPKSNLKK